MGSLAEFPGEKLIIGILTAYPELLDELREELEKLYGQVERVDGPFPFTFTTYYEEEFGKGLEKYFFTFTSLVNPDTLANIKLATNELEGIFSRDGKRKINLDPGILSGSRFILATTKDRGHRIPLQKGVYGEVTLIYMHKDFQVLPWTYADFASADYRAMLKEIRKTYIKQQQTQHE